MNNSEVEIWKSIQNYPDYEVSNLGRVRSYKRSLFEPHILARKLCKTGYYAVGLSKPGSKTNWANIHRLVAFAFVEGYFEGALAGFCPINVSTASFFFSVKLSSMRRKCCTVRQSKPNAFAACLSISKGCPASNKPFSATSMIAKSGILHLIMS